MSTFDYVIVGAGSAGACLAARLSEDPRARVLLLEAGPDYPSCEATPAALLEARPNLSGAYDWGFEAHPVPERSGPYHRGKLVGGTSAINAALAVRGTPADFDDWAARGNPLWSWDSVLPYILRLENDQDYRDAIHGTGGPVPVVRWRTEEWTAEQRAFYHACRAAGFADLPDHNHPQAEGVGSAPMNRIGLQRVSTARAYLDPVRQRPNLTIRSHCLVDQVRFSGEQAVGVDLGYETVYANRILLSAGAIGSPAILLRSGIGPARDLMALGIAPRLDLPGVGAQLWDHPSAPLWLAPQQGVGDPSAPYFQVMARYTERGDAGSSDMFLVMAGCTGVTDAPVIQAAVGGPVAFAICPVLMQPRSVGRLTLVSADPHQQPVIDLNFLGDAEDLRMLMAGLRRAWDIARRQEMRSVVARVADLDDAMVASDDALAAYVRANVDTFCHALGTARMGATDDAGAVVDEQCRVRGMAGLWVADASVIPAPPRVPPHLITIMIAERVADYLKQ
jgi:choline dehydrogenase